MTEFGPFDQRERERVRVAPHEGESDIRRLVPQLRRILTKEFGEKHQRLFAARCARWALEVCKQDDPRCLKAITTCEMYARGQASISDLEAIRLDAWAAVESADHQLTESPYAQIGEPGYASRDSAHLFWCATQSAYGCTLPSSLGAVSVATSWLSSELNSIGTNEAKTELILLADETLVPKAAPMEDDGKLARMGELRHLPPLLIRRLQGSTEKSLRLYACKCARMIIEKAVAVDTRSRRAIEVSEESATGGVRKEDLYEANEMAKQALDDSRPGYLMQYAAESTEDEVNVDEGGAPRDEEHANKLDRELGELFSSAEIACSCSQDSARIAAVETAGHALTAIMGWKSELRNQDLVGLAKQLLRGTA